jgi:hypothetical protein
MVLSFAYNYHSEHFLEMAFLRRRRFLSITPYKRSAVRGKATNQHKNRVAVSLFIRLAKTIVHLK